MNKHLRGLGLAIVGAGLLSGAVSAQTAPPIPPASIPGQSAPESPASNPVCVRLEGQLAILTRGGSDPARAEQIRRSEDAVAKQQTDLDRLLAQAKRRGCEGGGFFALFTGQSAECQPLNAQIQQMRDNLDRSMNDLERFKSGNNSDQEGQRRQLIGALAQNNCGQQYRAAAEAAGPAGFFDAGGPPLLDQPQEPVDLAHLGPRQRRVQQDGGVDADGLAVVGGHAVLAVGYSDPKGQLIVRNSWERHGATRATSTCPTSI